MARKPFTLRPATESDYRYCYDLTKRNMYDLFCRHWGGWDASKFREAFHPAKVTIVSVNGKRRGFFALDKHSGSIHIENIQLSSPARGKGIGTLLMHHILSKYQDRKITLTTFSDNPALKLYLRCGFSITKREGDTIHMRASANPAKST